MIMNQRINFAEISSYLFFYIKRNTQLSNMFYI